MARGVLPELAVEFRPQQPDGNGLLMPEFTPQHDRLVGIDSDGCAFDTMELKHKECFIPQIIKHFGLQGVSKYAREVAEFVNLYSRSRGVNRFPALLETLARLRRRPEVRARGVPIPLLSALEAWVRQETSLANTTLRKAVESTGDGQLRRALEWSEAVNAAIAEMVKAVPPFPLVRESIEKLAPVADILVVSATPEEALKREWAEHDLTRFVVAIWGQESGTKRQFLGMAAKYPAGHSLMIGDAPGDYAAAQANGALFFPINPGAEEVSWKRFYEEGLDRFLNGTFSAQYQQALLDEFFACLPKEPRWRQE